MAEPQANVGHFWVICEHAGRERPLALTWRLPEEPGRLEYWLTERSWKPKQSNRVDLHGMLPHEELGGLVPESEEWKSRLLDLVRERRREIPDRVALKVDPACPERLD